MTPSPSPSPSPSSSRAVRADASPADIYEARFVPALFGPWARRVVEWAQVQPGHRVLDVACGTGVLTREAARVVGSTGEVIGLDPNPDMLAVARRVAPDLTWHEGRAEAVPFPADRFDAVVSQFGLMFFADPVAALREMRRVVRPGGTITVAVCDGLDRSPGYAVLAELLHRLFGHDVAQAFRAPFTLGDEERLSAIAHDAALPDARVTSHQGTVRFDTVDALVDTERACVWTLGGQLDDAQFEHLRREARISFRPFTGEDGMVTFTMPALVVTARG